MFSIQISFLLSLSGVLEPKYKKIQKKKANPTLWSSWLAKLHQGKSAYVCACLCVFKAGVKSKYFLCMQQPWCSEIIEKIESFESKTVTYLSQVCPALTAGHSARPPGADSPAHHLSRGHRDPHRPPVPGHRQRGQESAQQLGLLVLLHALPHVRCPDAHCAYL